MAEVRSAKKQNEQGMNESSAGLVQWEYYRDSLL